jgi:LCP family protein required for cell wall assembly
MEMSDTSTSDFFTQQAAEARGPEPPRPSRRKERLRRLKRILIASAASLVVLAGVLVGGAYWMFNHELGSVQRIHVAALDAKTQSAWSGGRPGSLNILLTASGMFPGQSVATGLIELLHLDSDQRAGAVISFPANLLVSVPGHGRQRIGETLALGGPSLMIETLERLTDIRIEHYSRITYSGLPQVVGSMGGVNVVVPYPTTSFGFYFHAGVNRINAANVLAYVRQPTVSQVTRTALQENLFRAILHKIANRGYFHLTNWTVLNAVVHAVSVDSDLNNSQLAHLALSLRHLSSGDGVSIDVPTTGSPDAGFTTSVFLQKGLASRLWRAIRTDSVAQLAHQYPLLVTPTAPG